MISSNEKVPTIVNLPSIDRNDLSTLEKTQRHFYDIYNRRNSIHLNSLSSRIDLLDAGIGDFADSIQKGTNQEQYGQVLARIVSRIFCVANGVNNLSVEWGMRQKYPVEGCAYCLVIPCECPEIRQKVNFDFGKNKEIQKTWSITQWQKHLDNLYGKKNREKGINAVLNRLEKEKKELVKIEPMRQMGNYNNNQVEEEYALELADTMAWTMGAANILNINLLEAIKSRYGNGCKKCEEYECVCGRHTLQSEKFY